MSPTLALALACIAIPPCVLVRVFAIAPVGEQVPGVGFVTLEQMSRQGDASEVSGRGGDAIHIGGDAA